jgi:hypothetical protein
MIEEEEEEKITQPQPCKMQTEQNRGYSTKENNHRASILG